jgi:hypothetical protein
MKNARYTPVRSLLAPHPTSRGTDTTLKTCMVTLKNIGVEQARPQAWL